MWLKGLSGEDLPRLLSSRGSVREGVPAPQRMSALVPTAMAVPSVTLGIDLGTTSVKAAVVEDAPGDPSGFVVLASCVRAARAKVAAQSAAAGPQVRQRPGAAQPAGAS